VRAEPLTMDDGNPGPDLHSPRDAAQRRSHVTGGEGMRSHLPITDDTRIPARADLGEGAATPLEVTA
jgi:hypothetical protein